MPLWTGWFSDGTPEEIVHALLTALARDYTDSHQRYLTGPRQTVLAYQPLADADWHAEHVGPFAHITAPDSFARLSFDLTGRDPREQLSVREDITQAWWLTGGCDTGHDWHATFALATPTHLVAAMAADMADPNPVPRAMNQIPAAHLPHVRLRRADQPALPGGTSSEVPPHIPPAAAPSPQQPAPRSPRSP